MKYIFVSHFFPIANLFCQAGLYLSWFISHFVSFLPQETSAFASVPSKGFKKKLLSAVEL